MLTKLLTSCIAVFLGFAAQLLVLHTLGPTAQAKNSAAEEGTFVDGQLSMDILSDERWQQVDKAVDRGLAWIALQQNADGAFHSNQRSGQPIITQTTLQFAPISPQPHGT